MEIIGKMELYIIDYNGESSINDTPNNVSDDLTKLYLNADGFYRHSVTPINPTSTAFSRLIIIKDNTASSTTIQSYVKWSQGEKSFNYVVDSVLYDWKI